VSQLISDVKNIGGLQTFDLLTGSPSGMNQLKELVLSLGVTGKLSARTKEASQLLVSYDLSALRLEEGRLWGSEFLESSPDGWARLPLAKLGSWGSGGTPTRGNQDYYGGEIPWLIIGDLNDGLVTKAANSITQKGLQESSATKVPIGAVLVAMYGSIGKSGIAGIECATNQAIAHCIPDPEIVSTKYLFFLIRAVKSRLFSRGRGLAQQNISQTILKHLLVAVPPLSEQAHIVNEIEELMDLFDKLELAQNLLSKLERSARESLVDAISNAKGSEELKLAWDRIANN
jgi:type I restriction enzyme S subunit